MAGPRITALLPSRTVDASFSRSNNTTPYAAGQVLGNGAPLTFSGFCFDKLGSSLILQATCVDEANQTTKPDLQLFLFDTAPTVFADAAAFAPVNADMERLVGIVSFPVANFIVANAGSGASGNVVCDAQNLGLAINTLSRDIYGVLVVRNAYTPIANEKFLIRMKVGDGS